MSPSPHSIPSEVLMQHGGFVLRHAPVGSFVLRAGSVAELERGSFRSERRVELIEGENRPIEVRLR